MADPATLLADIEAEISARLTGGTVEEYRQADGRFLRKTPLADLQKLRQQYAQEVARRSAGGGRQTISFGSE